MRLRPDRVKNYSKDLANPELDQMIGRFSTNMGRVGMVCCRKLKDRVVFVKRCHDTLQQGHGLIVLLDDSAIGELLALVEEGRRRDIDLRLSKLVEEVWLGNEASFRGQLVRNG